MAARDHVVGALDDDERRAGELGQRVASAASGWQRSSVPCTRSIGQRHRPTGRLDDLVAVERPKAASAVGDHRLDRRRRAPTRPRPRSTLVECGSDVTSLEEEPDEAGVVAPPVVAVDLRPALVASGSSSSNEHSTRHGCGGGEERDADRERHDARRRAPAARRREPDRPPDAVAAQARRGRRVPCPGRVHDGREVADDAVVVYASGVGRPIRAAVAAAVEGHDAVVPAEVGDLALPLARVDDRRRGQEHDRRVARRRRRRRRSGRRRTLGDAGLGRARRGRVRPSAAGSRSPRRRSRPIARRDEVADAAG